jgi:hypothetical protein
MNFGLAAIPTPPTLPAERRDQTLRFRSAVKNVGKASEVYAANAKKKREALAVEILTFLQKNGPSTVRQISGEFSSSAKNKMIGKLVRSLFMEGKIKPTDDRQINRVWRLV